MKPIMRNLTTVAMIVWCCLGLGPVLAQEAPSGDLEQLLETGAGWLEQVIPPEVLAHVAPPTDAEWEALGQKVIQVLEGGSLEEFAELAPWVEAALEVGSSLSVPSPVLDWLRQRLDYFAIAQVAVEACPFEREPVRAPAVPVVTNGTVRLVPPRLPPAPRPPPQVAARRLRVAEDTKLWRKRLAARPAPVGASALIPRLKRVFAEEGMPPQLVWLAEVESSLNPRARSPAGAVGLFQLMPATAQRLGLRLRPVDEREQPEKSAQAAARHLKSLHAEFASWPLALAAYNSGEGRVRRLMRRHRVNNFEALAPYLPLETRMYVPKVRALVSLREGVDLAALPQPVR